MEQSLNTLTILNQYKKWFRIVIILLASLIECKEVSAQLNHVLNPSFEQYSKCPYKFDQIKFANYWTPIDTINQPPIDSFGQYYCTPEYCNTCAGANPYAGVPWNIFFYHYPRTGNGMAQVQMFYDTSVPGQPYLRDYLQGKFNTTLAANHTYCVTFYVCLELGSGYGVNHIGAYLDNGIIDTTQNCGLPQTTHIPQIYENTIILDSIHWTKVEGSFIANGNEKYITIGNFFDFAHTNAIHLGPASAPYTYYLVDDVSVVESNIPAYAGGRLFKAKKDSLFIGRNEILPDCEWYRNGVLVDTLHAGFWVKDTADVIYVVKQSICGNVKYDTAWIKIVPVGVNSVGNESIFRVYPNPATNFITIQAPNNTSIANMAIYDMSGKVLMHDEVQFTNGEVRMPLSLKGGVYFIELRDERENKNIQRLTIL